MNGMLASPDAASIPLSGPGLARLALSLQEVFESSPIPMWIYDVASLRFLDVNEAAVRNYGYSRREFLSMTIGEIRPNEDLARLAESVEESTRQPGSHSAGIWRHRRKNGGVFFVEVIAHRLMRGGQPAEIIFALDVDARVRAEAETTERGNLAVLVAESSDALAAADTLRGGLQRCADLLNRYTSAIFVRIWTIGNDPRVLELQASAGALTSLDDQYARIPVGQPGVGTIAETGTAMVDNDILNSGWVADPERCRRWNMAAFVGHPLTIEDRVVGVATAFSSQPLTSAAVQAFKSVARGMAQFIERKRGEESLKNLAALVENSSDAIVMAAPDGKVTYMNNAGRELLGFDGPQAVQGLDISRLHGREAWQEVETKLIPACIRTGYWQGETQLRHWITGEMIDVLMSAFLIRDSNGGVISKAAVMHDIRDRKLVEEALRRAKDAAESASRLKSEFLANVSHEIRTPMNGIMAMTDLALETELSAEQCDYLETVKTSAATLLRILNDVLDFSKIEAGKVELENITFDLWQSIQEAIDLMNPAASRKGLQLICQIAPDVPRFVRGDPVRLRQVILNLIGNSVKFTGSGNIAVRARAESLNSGALLHFEVQDTGIGIPPEKRKTIFDAFSQADGSMTRRFGGTGLGLSISARLVELMGGRIWVESVEGQGSTFHFTAALF